MHVTAVLLAAGASRRFGGAKLLADAGGEPLVARTARALLDGGADHVVAVLGARAVEVGQALQTLVTRIVLNGRWEDGMFGSVRVGLAAADPESLRLAVVPADLATLEPADVRRVLDAGREAGPRTLVVGAHESRRGHPLVFSRLVAERVLRWPLGRKLSDVFLETDLGVELVPCGAGVVHDVDAPSDLAPVLVR